MYYCKFYLSLEESLILNPIWMQRQRHLFFMNKNYIIVLKQLLAKSFIVATDGKLNLQISALLLFQLDGFEQRLEVSSSKALVIVTLNHFQEQSGTVLHVQMVV